MLKVKTTFVLGAGASCRFGFPTGADLSRQICQLRNQSGGHARVKAFKAAISFQGLNSAAFLDSFQESGTHSIDAFLARRSIFADAGKAAIAACLLDCEKKINLFEVDDKANNSDWYGYLWSRMYDQVNKPEDIVSSNNLSFITFNYDRSLEQFLHTVVKNTFGLNAREAYSISSQFNIHHVHGDLGAFGPKNNFTYGLPEESENPQFPLDRFMSAAAASLRIIPADRADEIDEKAFDQLWNAENVVFLGYGFDNQNNDRLGINSLISRKKNEGLSAPRIYATTYGMSTAEREYAFNSIAGSRAELIHYSDKNCYDSLREWGVLLQG